MFDEKYIMTGILSMALIAAWQKPSLFKEHIVNKIMFLTVAVFFLFITWSAALQLSIEALPSSLNEEQIAETKKNIEAFLVPISWWIFNFIMYVSVFVLDWLAGVSQSHEKKN